MADSLEKLGEDIRRAGRDLDPTLERVARAELPRILEEARDGVAVDTGELRASISGDVSRPRDARGELLTWGSSAKHAPFAEARHPVLGETHERAADRLAEEIADAMVDGFRG